MFVQKCIGANNHMLFTFNYAREIRRAGVFVTNAGDLVFSRPEGLTETDLLRVCTMCLFIVCSCKHCMSNFCSSDLLTHLLALNYCPLVFV